MVHSKSEKRYQFLIHVILLLITISMIFPFVLIFVSSFTSEKALADNGYTFFPEKWSMEAYEYIWENRSTVLRGYRITVISTVVGTIVHVLLAALSAYPLTVKKLPGKGVLTFYLLFTLLFSGGLVPVYIMWVTDFEIKNTLFAYIVPNLLVSVYHIFLVRAYLETTVPGDLYDAAKIDGMGHWGIFREIVLPMARPVLAAITLLVGLQYWNDWLNGLYYINKSTMLSVQALLNRMIQDVEALSNVGTSCSIIINFPIHSLRMAITVVVVLPILMVYPFLYKPLVSSVTLGVKKK